MAKKKKEQEVIKKSEVIVEKTQPFKIQNIFTNTIDLRNGKELLPQRIKEKTMISGEIYTVDFKKDKMLRPQIVKRLLDLGMIKKV